MGMTIEKAIELLDIAKEGWPVGDNEDYYKAASKVIVIPIPTSILYHY